MHEQLIYTRMGMNLKAVQIKPVSKGHLLQGSMYMTFPNNRSVVNEGELISGCQGYAKGVLQIEIKGHQTITGSQLKK